MYSQNCDLRNYYIRQAGSGLRVFKVPKGQVGYNIFSNFFRKYGVDLLKFIGRKSWEPVKEIGREVVFNRANPKEAIKKGLKKSAKNIALGVIDKVKDKVEQIGTGRKRRKVRRTKVRGRRAKVRKSSKRVQRRRARNTITPKKNYNYSQHPTGDVFGY